jgi:hypothetical protein
MMMIVFFIIFQDGHDFLVCLMITCDKKDRVRNTRYCATSQPTMRLATAEPLSPISSISARQSRRGRGEVEKPAAGGNGPEPRTSN